MPAAVGLCAYRVVQAALSNASRHAPASAVSVRLEGAEGCLQVSVVNGSASGPAASTGPHQSGQGLLGMRERAALLGGSFRAGPTPDGGFALGAVLPLDDGVVGPLHQPAPG